MEKETSMRDFLVPSLTHLHSTQPIVLNSPELLGASLKNEKILVAPAMAVVTLLCGMLPLKIFSHARGSGSSRTGWQTFISLCQCFSGGVFLAAGMLDLLRDVVEKVDEVLDQVKATAQVEVTFPVAYFLTACGFLLILSLEQAVLGLQEAGQRSGQSEQELLLNTHHHHQQHHHHPSIGGLSDQAHHAGDGHGHHHSHMAHSLSQHSSLRSLSLLLAISVHSVFEGLAIGLQDNSAQLLSIFLAVMAHKAVMAFSLGLNLAQSSLSTRSFLLSTVVFSLASPVGVGLALAILDLPSSIGQDICNAVLQAIAAGTFLYITFFEVLPHELNMPNKRMMKVFFVFLGFAFMCGLIGLTD